MCKLVMFFTGMIVLNVPMAKTIEAQRAAPTAAERRLGEEIQEQMLRGTDPDLVQRAAVKGIYKYAEYPILRTMNPYYIRGDFDGDGKQDVAFWVTQQSSGLKGVAIIHSSLDTVYFLGAGHGNPFAPLQQGVDAWDVLPTGRVLKQALGSTPEIGEVEGKPFTFRREALQFLWLGKSSFACYWANGRYWYIQTSD